MSVTTEPTFVPPEQVGLPASATQPVVTEVQLQQEAVAAQAAAVAAALVILWADIDVLDPFSWWYGGGAGSPAERAFLLTSIGQENAANTARDYVLRAMAAQGFVVAAPALDGLPYAGHASDGATLESKLEGAVWQTWLATKGGKTPEEAKAAGLARLLTLADTEVDDAAREATAALTATSTVVRVSPRATEDTDAGREVLSREIIAQVADERAAARVLDDVERILAEEALREQIRARAEEEERRAERRARLAADEARRLAERAREQADADVIREAERILEEADVREAVREAERIARFAARRRERQAKPEYTLGWVRVLTPPSCGRCIILAGRFYRWTAAFQRHPHCDCLQIPTTVVAADTLVTDPYATFESMTTEEQNEAFGAGKAEAIRAGANMAQVVNAYNRGQVFAVDGRTYTRAGTTKRGSYKFSEAGKAGALRATPTTLIREAKGDQERARELLRRFGYITD